MNRSVRLLAALLFVSVAGNVAAGGYLLARAFDQRPPRFERALTEAAEGRLSPASRAALDAAMAAARPHMRAAWDEVGEARREIAAILAADPVDRARLDAAFARLRAATAASQTALHGAVTGAVVQMQPEERTTFLDHWRHHRRGGRPPEGPRPDGLGPR